MNASRRPKPSVELDVLEARMGELAALLSEVADALTSYPEAIRVVGDAAEAADASGETATVNLNVLEWPTIQEIERLLANWRQLREMSDRG